MTVQLGNLTPPRHLILPLVYPGDRVCRSLNLHPFLFLVFIPALSKESSGILLLPLSVRPSVRKKSLPLELRLHFKINDTLGSHWACLVDAQEGFNP